MAETQTLHSKYRYQLRQSVANALGDGITGTPTGAGLATTITDANRTEAADYFNNWDLAIYSGTHKDKTRTVSDYATPTLTIATVGAITGTTDLYELHRKFTTVQYNDFINRAIDISRDNYFKSTSDETTYLQYFKFGETRVPKREYDIPTGFDFIRDVYMESNIPYQIEDCEDTWNELVDADVTSAIDIVDYQEGSASIKLTVGAGLVNGDIIATEVITSTNLSPYAKVQFWIKASVSCAASDLQLLLDNSVLCGSPLETLNIGALTANTWSLQTLTLANPLSDTAIISVGLKFTAGAATKTIWVDDVCVIKAGEPRFDEDGKIDRRSWSIVHATTPQLKLHTEVPITAAKHLRIVGQVSQGSLSLDADPCFIDPEFIIQQACAFAYQSQEQYDAMITAQKLADMWRKRSKVQLLPGSRAVKEL